VSVESSSIQRFLQNRASQLIMANYGRQSWVWHVAIGGGLIALAAGMVIGGLVAGIGGLAVGATGPLIGGGINLVMGLKLRTRYHQNPNEPRISPEAKAFLVDLMKQTHTGWNSGHGYRRHGPQPSHFATPLSNGNTVLHQLGKHWGVIPKTPQDVLSRPLHDLLETACRHYNRVYGILEGNQTENAVSKVAQSARQGADEAIFAILHHASTMNRFPETISSASRECEEKIRALRELADGLERIQGQPVPITDRLSYTSAMDNALETVRLEQLAREELGRHTDPEQQLRERL
jgi:hypothetical protein